MAGHSYLRKNLGYFGSRVEAEELLPHSHDIQLHFKLQRLFLSLFGNQHAVLQIKQIEAQKRAFIYWKLEMKIA
ncbi:type I inositol-1,4,5-trisphosphate 5-phosphatase [Musa troglodytarum]|uniref:Type I inositol-1,4,5-trisphosphate 5-phosphatase n=1 Tax=Musa troglodytarum TaxID=320322 RepID=A0A9E7F630_9LILI|nr:type I inositol-1,4,5-trisphosphate 5-phosphatase [Musa troglodytarum]